MAESRLDQISSNFAHISSSLDVPGRNTENWKLGRSYREGNVGRSLARSHFGFEIGRDAPKIRAPPGLDGTRIVLRDRPVFNGSLKGAETFSRGRADA